MEEEAKAQRQAMLDKKRQQKLLLKEQGEYKRTESSGRKKDEAGNRSSQGSLAKISDDVPIPKMEKKEARKKSKK